MLDRNRRIKARPERFQDTKENFDIVITAEERVYDQVVESKDCGLVLCCQDNDNACADFLCACSAREIVEIQ